MQKTKTNLMTFETCIKGHSNHHTFHRAQSLHLHCIMFYVYTHTIQPFVLYTYNLYAPSTKKTPCAKKHQLTSRTNIMHLL
jgi:hypothetical protein